MLKKLTIWRLLLLVIVFSQIITALMGAVLGVVWWGKVSGDLFYIGAIIAFVNCAVVAPPTIYVAKRISRLYLERDVLQREVMQRKRAEKDLRVKENAISSSISGIAMSDLSGRITYANKSALGMWGYASEEEVVGMEAGAFLRDEARAVEVIRTLLEKGSWIGELAAKRRDGTLLDVEIAASVVRDAGGLPLCMMISCVEVTERKRAEEERRKLQRQLQQSQKMESIGRLAGGVAHDFNNILTVIVGYGELALLQARDNPPLRERLGRIVEAGRKASSLAQQLLAFSRKQVLDMKVVDLNAVIGSISVMLKRVIGEDVALELNTKCRTGNVMADAGQMEQILMNIAINARDAMPDGGTLTIETASIRVEEPGPHPSQGPAPGSYVMVSISDTGTGMQREVRERIFEPFFSTKEHGKGTGLGLATVYGIVKQHNGFIYVFSNPGEGTAFRIYLPAVDEDVAPSDGNKAAAWPGGKETVLVVEDDSGVRGFAAETLRVLGYRVIEASGGAEALKAAETFAGPIHVLLTDVIMPGMNGKDLAGVFCAKRPDTRVLFMSGYTDDIIGRHGILEPETYFMQKPLVPLHLAAKLREVLDEKGGEKSAT